MKEHWLECPPEEKGDQSDLYNHIQMGNRVILVPGKGMESLAGERKDGKAALKVLMQYFYG